MMKKFHLVTQNKKVQKYKKRMQYQVAAQTKVSERASQLEVRSKNAN